MSDMQPYDPGSGWQPPATRTPPPPPPPFAAAPGVPVPAAPPAVASPPYGTVGHDTAGRVAGYPTPPMTDQRSPGTAVVVIAWVVTVFTLGYMLPWAIAATRGRSNQAAIGLINLLLGWTFIGWVAALVMACQSHQMIGHAAHTVAVAVNVQQSASPAGWYQAPSGLGRRYWDGNAWTDHHTP